MGTISAVLVGVIAFWGYLLDATPIARTGWRWLLERQMEIGILPAKWMAGRDEKISLAIGIEPDATGRPAPHPYIHALFGLQLINHRTDRKERVLAVDLAFKRHRAWLWRKTFLAIPVCYRESGGDLRPIENVELEPQSAPVELQCRVEHAVSDGSVRVDMFPNRFEIWLVLRMVGPLRRTERRFQVVDRPRAGFLDRYGPGW